MKPATMEIQMELTMPFAPEMFAWIVSSVTWADASYPVNVYCAFSRPMRKMQSGTENPESPLNAFHPSLPNRNETDWWECEEGAQYRMTTMTATPIRCQYTETSLRRATRRMPKVFSRPWMKRTTARMAIVCPGDSQ